MCDGVVCLYSFVAVVGRYIYGLETNCVCLCVCVCVCVCVCLCVCVCVCTHGYVLLALTFHDSVKMLLDCV